MAADLPQDAGPGVTHGTPAWTTGRVMTLVVTVRADAGVSSPALPWLAGELLAAGLMVGLPAAALIVVPIRLAGSRR